MIGEHTEIIRCMNPGGAGLLLVVGALIGLDLW